MSVPSAPQISAVLIVKNEEAVLDECLAALHWVDEIVVYDTGSTDATREIAAKYTDCVIEGFWDDDFAGARNRAIEHATGEWILTVDADEIFTGDGQRLRAALDPRPGCHTILVENLEDGGRHSTSMSSIRFFLRGAFEWSGRLHEQVAATAPDRSVLNSTPIANISLVHSGYLVSRIVEREKGTRNLEMARAELALGLADGLDDAHIAVLRANVARSLGLTGQWADGLSLGQEVLASGLLSAESIAILAAAMVELAVELGDDAAIDAMLAWWLANDSRPTWALARKARILARREDAAETLNVLEQIPTTAVNSRQVRFVKHELAGTHVWALLRSGRVRDATKVAMRAAQAGYCSVVPAVLAEIFAHAKIDLADYIRVVPQVHWTTLALQAASNPVRWSRVFLEEMYRVRPGDVAVLTCASSLARIFSLEEAAHWAVELRTHGMAQDCPLVAIALDLTAEPRQRAIAGAIALDVYGDDRALAGLEAALELIPADQEDEVLSYLDVVAPGLITRA